VNKKQGSLDKPATKSLKSNSYLKADITENTPTPEIIRLQIIRIGEYLNK